VLLYPELPEQWFLDRAFYETLCGLRVKFEDIVDHGSDCSTCSRLLLLKANFLSDESET